MEHISVTTEKIIKNWQSNNSLQELKNREDIETAVKKILTIEEFKHIKCIFLKGTQIIMNVDSSAWLYMFSARKKQILKKINQDLKLKTFFSEMNLRLDTSK